LHIVCILRLWLETWLETLSLSYVTSLILGVQFAYKFEDGGTNMKVGLRLWFPDRHNRIERVESRHRLI